MTAPLRFLLGLVGLWCFGRAGVLLWPEGAFLPVAASRAAPGAAPAPGPAAAASVPPSTVLLERAGAPTLPTQFGAMREAVSPVSLALHVRTAPTGTTASMVSPGVSARSPAMADDASGPLPPVARQGPVSLGISPAGPSPKSTRVISGVSVSSWALWRSGDGGSAAFGAGTLGGSQAGVRALFPLLAERVHRLALSARASAPLRRRGAEVALGLEWQPSADIPVRVLAERRQRVTGDGRSAFALLAHGGVSERALSGGLTLDAYGAVGVVGARSRDLFAEGAATVTRRLGPVRVGAGLWGGAQPGTKRLDLGPTVALPLRLRGAGMRISLDYRLRVAGSATPGSGPALTVGTDF